MSRYKEIYKNMKIKDLLGVQPIRGYSQADLNANLRQAPKDAELLGITPVFDENRIVCGFDCWLAIKSKVLKTNENEADTTIITEEDSDRSLL